MNRNVLTRFLLIIALVAVVTSSCRKNRDTIPRVDFTIDLNDPNHPEYQSLNALGGTVQFSNYQIVVGHGYNGYFAVTSFCTAHNCTLEYQSFSDQLKCPCSSCLFNTDGTVAQGPATNPLIKYTTQLNGQFLRIYSP